ncbi:hypothetical protein D3C71_1196140 [compost metagenome]
MTARHRHHQGLFLNANLPCVDHTPYSAVQCLFDGDFAGHVAAPPRYESQGYILTEPRYQAVSVLNLAQKNPSTAPQC